MRFLPTQERSISGVVSEAARREKSIKRKKKKMQHRGHSVACVGGIIIRTKIHNSVYIRKHFDPGRFPASRFTCFTLSAQLVCASTKAPRDWLRANHRLIQRAKFKSGSFLFRCSKSIASSGKRCELFAYRRITNLTFPITNTHTEREREKKYRRVRAGGALAFSPIIE